MQNKSYHGNMKEILDCDISSLGTSLVVQLVKNIPAVQKMWLNPWVRKCPGGGNGNPLQFRVGNPKDSGAWRAIVHEVAKVGDDLRHQTTITTISLLFHSLSICMCIILGETICFKKYLKWQLQKTSNSQSNLEKEEWNWRNQSA